MKAKGAKESVEVQHAREQLKKRLDKEKKLATPEAISEITDRIHNWLHRHESLHNHLKLKDKTVILFDENRHPAKSSHEIQKLKKHLLAAEGSKSMPVKTLPGRVKKG